MPRVTLYVDDELYSAMKERAKQPDKPNWSRIAQAAFRRALEYGWNLENYDQPFMHQGDD